MKLRIPDETALKAAREEVQKLFANDFRSAKNAAQQVALAEKLLKLGQEIPDEPATRYVVLLEARELAVLAGHVELAMQAIDAAAETHAVDVLSSRWDVLERNIRRVRSATDAREFCGIAHALFQQAVKAGDYPLAEKIAKAEQSTASKSRDPRAVTESRADAQVLDGLLERWDALQKAVQEIANDPNDAAANTTVGLYTAFDRQNWAEALPHLKKADDKRLHTIAREEEQSPQAAKQQSSLADLWWEFAQTREGLDRQHALARSLHWYQKSVAELTGIERIRTETRIAEFDLPLSETEPVYLTDLEEFDLIEGPWGFAKGVKGVGNPVPILLGGKQAKKGLGNHPPSNGFSQMKYRLDGRFGTFVATVGLATDAGLRSGSPVVFVLIGDGRTLWTSGPLRDGQAMQTCAGDITGVKVLELRAVCSGRNEHAHACWGDPYVMRARGLAPR